MQTLAMEESTSTRQRRQHRKSRAGCRACKERHVRCDEQSPACYNCLLRGRICIYETLTPKKAPRKLATKTQSDHRLLKANLLNALPATPADPFDVMPTKMPYKSHEIFYHYFSFRNSLRMAVGRNDQNISAYQKATCNPAYFRSIMMTACFHYGAVCVPENTVAQTLLHHKGEAIRMLQKSIYSREMWEICLSGMHYLTLVETAMRETESAEIHLKGFFALLTLKERIIADCAKEEVKIRITLIGLALVLMSQKLPKDFDQETYSRFFIPLLIRDPRYRYSQAYAYHQIIGEFTLNPEIVRELVWGLYPPGSCYTGYGPTNERLLNWYLSVLHDAREESRLGPEQGDKDPIPYIASDETRRWVVAVAAYALSLASVSQIHSYPTSVPDKSAYPAWLETAFKNLSEIQQWFDEVSQRWYLSDALPTWDVLQQVLLKVAWMTTREGEDVVKLVLQGNANSRSYRDDMHMIVFRS